MLLSRSRRLVTIMFTDLENFTPMVEKLGDSKANEIVTLHNEFIKNIVEDNGAGIVHKYIGDAVLATFDQPSLAISKALEIQEKLSEFSKKHAIDPGLVIRIGLHLGELDYDESGKSEIISRHVNCASRVMSVADGSQILVTSSVYESAKGSELSRAHHRLKWVNHGEFYLKGIGPMELYEIADTRYRIPGLPSSVAQKGVDSDIRRLQFHGYEIIKRVGEGGMGIVYLAKDTNSSKETYCAIKVLKKLDEDEESRKLFINEIVNVSKLSHPGIVSIKDFQKENFPLFFVMEWLEGENIVSRAKDLPWKQKADLLTKVCDALVYAHENNVIHRDIKPSNIIVKENGDPILLDFGLSVSFDYNLETVSSTSKGFLGTPGYMSPEQIDSSGPIGVSTDIYAMGIVLYEILTGQIPFQDKSFHSILNAHLRQNPPLPILINPEVPEALQRICLKAISKNSKDRFQSIAELKEELVNYINNKKIKVRPVIYNNLIEDSANKHVKDIDEWHSKKLITDKEHVKLSSAYTKLLRKGMQAVVESRMIHLNVLLIYFLGWLVLHGTASWFVIHYDKGILEFQSVRIMVAVFPALLINLFWYIYHKKGAYRKAFALMILGIMSIPFSLGMFLHEITDIFEIAFLSDSLFLGWAITPEIYQLVKSPVELRALLNDPVPNIQLLITFLFSFFWATFLAWRTRSFIGTILSCLFLLLLYTICLDMFGHLVLIVEEQRFAEFSLRFLPLVIGLTVLGYYLTTTLNRKEQGVAAFFISFLLFLSFTQIIAVYGIKEWYIDRSFVAMSFHRSLSENDIEEMKDEYSQNRYNALLEEVKQKTNLSSEDVYEKKMFKLVMKYFEKYQKPKLILSEGYEEFLKDFKKVSHGVGEIMIGIFYLCIAIQLMKFFKIESVMIYTILIWMSPLSILGGLTFLNESWPHGWFTISLFGDRINLPLLILLAAAPAVLFFSSKIQSYFFIICGLAFTAYPVWRIASITKDEVYFPLTILIIGVVALSTISYRYLKTKTIEDIDDVAERLISITDRQISKPEN